MKKIVGVFLFYFMFLIINCYADNYDDAMKAILAEKTVIHASWGPVKGSSLYVSVKDDGTNRDGFAQFLCLILTDYEIKGLIIHIMTPENLKNFNTDDDLGKFICE